MTRSTGINRHHGSHQTNFRCSKQILSKNIPHLVIYGLHIKSSLQSCLNNKIPFLSPPFFLSLNAYRCCFCTLLRRLHLGVSNYSPQCEFWVDQQWQPRVTTPFFFPSSTWDLQLFLYIIRVKWTEVDTDLLNNPNFTLFVDNQVPIFRETYLSPSLMSFFPVAHTRL